MMKDEFNALMKKAIAAFSTADKPDVDQNTYQLGHKCACDAGLVSGEYNPSKHEAVSMAVRHIGLFMKRESLTAAQALSIYTRMDAAWEAIQKK